MYEAFQQILNGLSLASVFALVGVGITLIFGLTGIVNFAQGEFLMVGGFVTWWLVGRNMPYVAALLLSVAVVGALGFALERGMWRFTLQRPINGFVISLGVSVTLQNTIVRIWDASQQPVSIPVPVRGDWSLAGGHLVFQGERFLILGVTAAVLLVGIIALRRTTYGCALRALSENRQTAATMGIPVGRYVTAVFTIGSALAGIGGALLIGLFPLSPYSGQTYVVTGFAVALIGGLGSIGGAVAAALILGMVEVISAGYLWPAWTDAFAFVLMIFVLVARPQGLFRGAEGSSVG